MIGHHEVDVELGDAGNSRLAFAGMKGRRQDDSGQS